MGQAYVQRCLFNLARLAAVFGLTAGIFGAALLLSRGLSGAVGNLLFLAAALLPVLVCVRGFEKRPFRAAGLTARGCDCGYFLFGVLWAALCFALLLSTVCLLTARDDFSVALRQTAHISRLTHYLVIGFCEELLFRGYLFQNLFCEQPFWRRSLLSASLFLTLYLITGQGNGTFDLMFAFLFALLMNYLVYRTGSIWMGVGLNAMWKLLAVSCFYDQGTGMFAAPLFSLVLLASFPLLRRLFDGLERQAVPPLLFSGKSNIL